MQVRIENCQADERPYEFKVKFGEPRRYRLVLEGALDELFLMVHPWCVSEPARAENWEGTRREIGEKVWGLLQECGEEGGES
jgi:hypothetical protein